MDCITQSYFPSVFSITRKIKRKDIPITPQKWLIITWWMNEWKKEWIKNSSLNGSIIPKVKWSVMNSYVHEIFSDWTFRLQRILSLSPSGLKSHRMCWRVQRIFVGNIFKWVFLILLEPEALETYGNTQLLQQVEKCCQI